MSNEQYKTIFSKNLQKYMELNNKNQMDLMNDLNLSSSTISNWCTGLKLPKMDSIQMLADYFGILKSDLIEEKENGEKYYLNQEVQELAQEMMEKPNLHMLCDASRDLSPEDMQIVIDMVNRMNK